MKTFLSVLILLQAFINLTGQSKFTDQRDGNVYRVITVEGVAWMAENLRFKANEGVFFNNDSNNAKTYGALYDWKTATRSQQKQQQNLRCKFLLAK
jgi:uncharacterized protein (TIGR02145 family)